MLVLLGPPFSGSDDEYARLSAVTGLVAYDLKTKLKADAWGVVKVIGDPAQAVELRDALARSGFRVAMVDPAVGGDPARMFVPIRAVELGETELVLHLTERSMSIPYRAVLCIVRGEVQVGSFKKTASSSGFRAVVPTRAEVEVFREKVSTAQVEAYAAADIHFATVEWAARIDARAFDFSVLGSQAGAAEGLDRLVELLADRASVRVDRASRISSVASFATGGPARAATPMPGQGPGARRETPERFDAYSRLIGEAERQAARAARTSTRPPPPA